MCHLHKAEKRSKLNDHELKYICGTDLQSNMLWHSFVLIFRQSWRYTPIIGPHLQENIFLAKPTICACAYPACCLHVQNMFPGASSNKWKTSETVQIKLDVRMHTIASIPPSPSISDSFIAKNCHSPLQDWKRDSHPIGMLGVLNQNSRCTEEMARRNANPGPKKICFYGYSSPFTANCLSLIGFVL